MGSLTWGKPIAGTINPCIVLVQQVFSPIPAVSYAMTEFGEDDSKIVFSMFCEVLQTAWQEQETCLDKPVHDFGLVDFLIQVGQQVLHAITQCRRKWLQVQSYMANLVTRQQQGWSFSMVGYRWKWPILWWASGGGRMLEMLLSSVVINDGANSSCIGS